MREMLIAKELEDRIISHVARYNQDYQNIVKEYHMDEIRQIRTYMMRIVGDCLSDARILNACFHKAIEELGIDVNKLVLPVKSEKVSYSRITM
jgi:hypothetical protein